MPSAEVMLPQVAPGVPVVPFKNGLKIHGLVPLRALTSKMVGTGTKLQRKELPIGIDTEGQSRQCAGYRF